MSETSKQSETSKLIDDLTKVPNIIAGLGLSVASAQAAFNLDYMNNIERLLAMIKSLYGGEFGPEVTSDDQKTKATEKFEQMKGAIMDLLKSLAPSRYQFTETTLSVKLDLAQTMDLSTGVGLGLGFGGVSVSASVAIGYGSDYRGAAEVTTKLQAYAADPTVTSALIARAKELDAKALNLPDRSEVDNKIIEKSESIFEKMVGVLPKPVNKKSSESTG